jgi:ParB-like chromosome segregation protein Spo0J
VEIRVIPIEQINAAAYNPRVDLQPGDPEYEKLKNSIEQFGYDGRSPKAGARFLCCG